MTSNLNSIIRTLRWVIAVPRIWLSAREIASFKRLSTADQALKLLSVMEKNRLKYPLQATGLAALSVIGAMTTSDYQTTSLCLAIAMISASYIVCAKHRVREAEERMRALDVQAVAEFKSGSSAPCNPQI